MKTKQKKYVIFNVLSCKKNKMVCEAKKMRRYIFTVICLKSKTSIDAFQVKFFTKRFTCSTMKEKFPC